MLLRLCQLKSLHLLVCLMACFSCSWRKKEAPASSKLLNLYGTSWFGVSSDHSLVTSSGATASHLFFDTTPDFNPTERTVNSVVLVSKNSAHSYSLDLRSGQRYYSHSYCSQIDVWNNFSGSIGRPFFSIGHIPRVLDQLGNPQKIIIWSQRADFAQDLNTNYQKVKIIGGYVEQICPGGNCLGRNNWLSRLVLVGVDAFDSELSSLRGIEDFSKLFNWEKSKAYLENIDGRNFIGEKTFPAFRVSQLIAYEDAFNYFKKRSIFLTDKKLKKIQKACHILYDKLWEEVGKIRPEDRGAKTEKELNEKIKLQKSLRKQKLPVGFAQRLGAFTRKFFHEISTCDKFVYHGNINQDLEKFWFLNYMNLFYRLHKDGHYYSCRARTWQRNVLTDDGKPRHDITKDIDSCGEGDIDQAMEYLPNYLKSLKMEKDYYRFIDYDNHTFGTHQKLYSWIRMESRKLDCGSEFNERTKNDRPVFPHDILWKKRNIKDISDRLKLIY